MKLNPAHIGLKKARIEMLPLIDIVFLVLVVFIYAMLSMAVHRGLPVVLPQAAATTVESDSRLTINLLADGTLLLNRRPITPTALRETLTARAAEQPQPTVLLFGDRDLDYQQLFRVLDLIRQAGIERISLQAEAPDGP
ncbi:ExbD/TolR family protein [Desulfurivibrio sp. D14AmB]|uniref:ExbD/TolR family protein n=1 Tax=Desulfurivibrio sp. D14AmB TaxID=3374370 RepID=UPI00376EDA4E